MVTILKNLVSKTATVRSAKLPTPADRIGLGLVAVATYPAEVLSFGQFPLPTSPDSEPNPGGYRQELSADAMRGHPSAMATAEPPAGPVGRPVPGSSAHRWPRSFMQPLALRGCPTIQRPAATGRLTSLPAVATSRASFPVATSARERIGDCQSPDRRDARRAAMSWGTSSNAVAAI